jgi:hypothetical protein
MMGEMQRHDTYPAHAWLTGHLDDESATLPGGAGTGSDVSGTDENPRDGPGFYDSVSIARAILETVSRHYPLAVEQSDGMCLILVQFSRAN